MKPMTSIKLPCIILLTGMTGLPITTRGQSCGCGPTYSVQSQTVMEEQLEQRFRIVYDLVYEDQEVTSQRLVPRTRMEKRTHTVSKPVVETSTVEERYTVLKPVTRREWIDQSYDETTMVTETAERDETFLSLRPVVETQMQTQNYVVQRSVTETQMQVQQQTVFQPVTTFNTAVVDQGQYYAQQMVQPGDTRYGLRWLPAGPTADGAFRRAGFGWVPYTSAGSTFTQLEFRSNPVQVAIPQTSLMPQVQQIQVPVQVTRMESEVVQQQVPVTVTRMETVQEVRKVPYSVQKPVTRRIERKVPVDKVEWVEQQMSRPKTIEKTSFKLETVEQEVPVQFFETQSVVTKVKVPRRVARYEPYTVRRLVPRTVQSPVVLSYSDPYSVPLSMGHSAWMPSASSPTVSSSSNGNPAAGTESIIYGEPKEVGEPKPVADSQSSVDDSDQPRSSLKVEMVEPAVDDLPPSASDKASEGIELTPSTSEEGPKA